MVYTPDIQGEPAVGTAGFEFTFATMLVDVVIQVRGNSSPGSICYVQLNQIPEAASPADGRIGLGQNGTIALQGAIRSLGAIMDNGTAIVEVVGYKFKDEGEPN